MQLYGSGPWSTGDDLTLFDGAGRDAAIDERWVTVSLVRTTLQSIWAPRQVICKETGFNHLPPESLDISIGGEVYHLSRSRH